MQTNIKLRLIRLSDSKTQLTIVDGQPTDYKVKLNQRLAFNASHMIAICRTEVSLTAAKENSSVLIEAAFESTYDSDQVLGDADLQGRQREFMADAWPFIREYVYNIGSRMALPTLMLPLLFPEPSTISDVKHAASKNKAPRTPKSAKTKVSKPKTKRKP